MPWENSTSNSFLSDSRMRTRPFGSAAQDIPCFVSEPMSITAGEASWMMEHPGRIRGKGTRHFSTKSGALSPVIL